MFQAAQKGGAWAGGNKKFDGSARYFTKGLEAVLEKQLGNTLLSSALTRVLITSYDMAYGEPLLFSSFGWPPGAIIGTEMRVAARATSAGPTYFKPQVVTVGLQQRVLVDGGVFANNPATIGYALGSALAALAGRPLLLLSLGTGTPNPARPLSPTEATTQNWLSTAKSVFEAAMTGSGQLGDMLLPSLMNSSGQPARYVRIQTTVENCNFAMDDSSPENTRCLAELALRVAKSHEPQLRALFSDSPSEQVA
jgi:predicted acylesterase/phospholipase RssA